MKQLFSIFCFFLVLLSACRKSDNPDPVDPTPVDPTLIPPLFTDTRLQIMADFEKANNMSRQGHLLTKSIQETDPFGTLSTIFDALTFLMNIGVHEQEMNMLYGKLNNLLKQDSILQVMMTNLSSQLNFNTTMIINQLNNTVLLNYITDIQTHMGAGSSHGLRYFIQAGANYQNNVSGYDSLYIEHTIKPQANAFINHTMTSPDLENDINGIYLLMNPVIPLDTSCIMTFSKLLIGQFTSRNLCPDSLSNLMNTYLILESYFYTLLNYQFQATTVKMNVLKQTDTLQAQSFFNNNFKSVVLDECNMFLQATGTLMLSICEYRTQARWKENMAYAGLFMAPNNHIYQPMARAQFTVRLLYSLLGISDNAINGSIFVPRNYCTSDPLVSVGGIPAQSAWVNQLTKSRNPYTLWTGNSQPTCAPDNLFHIYHYTINPGTGASQTMNINIIPTWPNTSTGPGYGTITPLWYNPRNPEETSPVETDSCTLNFASFCLSWEWGNLMSDYIALSPGMDNRNLYCNFGSPLFCPWCGNGSSSQQLNAPLIVQWHSSQQIFENFQTDYTRTYGMNSSHLQSPFNYQLQVTVQPYSSGAVYVYDQVGTPVGVDHCLQGGSISLFSSYTCNATFAPAPSVQASEFRIGSLLADCHTYCGLNCSSRPCYLSSGDAITGSYTNGSGYGFGSPYQNFSGHLTPSYQYWFNIYHSDNPTNLNVNIRINAQEVFLGYSGY